MIALLVLATTVLALASGAIAGTWQRYGQAALGARREWLECPQTREVRFRIVQYGAKPGGRVIALPVRPKAAPTRVQPPLRAAA
ncbi:MAG: hypothetical protein U9R07_16115 [Pseudomonadota bacterium]|nr:hypothetical protein [Pseudomonadota bacterium]